MKQRISGKMLNEDVLKQDRTRIDDDFVELYTNLVLTLLEDNSTTVSLMTPLFTSIKLLK